MGLIILPMAKYQRNLTGIGTGIREEEKERDQEKKKKKKGKKRRKGKEEGEKRGEGDRMTSGILLSWTTIVYSSPALLDWSSPSSPFPSSLFSSFPRSCTCIVDVHLLPSRHDFSLPHKQGEEYYIYVDSKSLTSPLLLSFSQCAKSDLE